MLTRIKGGRIIDPVHGRDAVGDLWIEDGHVVEPPADARPDETIDANGCVVMAGGIDVHSHIASGNVILSRLLLPEYAVAEAPSPDLYPFAAIRRSQLAVVCLQSGDGDGGHTSVCLAQALGTPVIASRVPGVIDYVKDRIDAHVIPPGDARALASAIRWLWSDSAARSRLVSGGFATELARRPVSEGRALTMIRRAAEGRS